MGKIKPYITGAALAAAAWPSPPGYNYEGQWGSPGFGEGQFNVPYRVPEAASNVHLTATMKNCVPAYKTDLNIQ